MDRGTVLRYLLAALLVVFALGVVVYWALYFLVGGTQVVNEIWYTKFEDAFPVADAWASLLCLVSAYFLLRRDERMAPFFLAAAGASVLYLGFMDVTFDVENNLYPLVATNGNMQTELIINIFSVVLGILALAYGLAMIRRPHPGG